MKEKFNFITIISIAIAIVFAYLFYTKKPEPLVGMSPPGKIPATTQVLLAYTGNDQFVIMDKDANDIPRCYLCDAENARQYGKKCENAPPEIQICKTLVNATVRETTTITFIKSNVNPDCDTMIIGNIPYPWPPGCGS